jgi:O-antigen/teichoic acid export membrane protein
MNPKLHQRWQHLAASSLVRDGLWMSLLGMMAKAANFVASAFAAQCVGAANFGVTGVIATMAAQSALLFNGGLDTVASREMAEEPQRTQTHAADVTVFRLSIGLAVAALWAIVTWVVVPHHVWAVWQLGVVLMLSGALNLTYLFQARGKLPVFNLIAAAASVVTAIIYFFFTPAMPLGSDLLVFAAASLAATAASWSVAVHQQLISFSAPHWNFYENWQRIAGLLRQSRAYWLIAAAQYFYTNFQLIIVATGASASEVGAFRSALVMAGALDVVYGSFYNLLLPRFAQWQQQGDALFLERRRKMLWLFIGIGSLCSGGVILLSPLLYKNFFGDAFASGQTALMILAAAKAINFLGQLYAYTLVVYKQDIDVMKGCLTGAITSVALGFYLTGMYGITAAAAATLIGECLITLMYVWFSRAGFQKRERGLSRDS